MRLPREFSAAQFKFLGLGMLAAALAHIFFSQWLASAGWICLSFLFYRSGPQSITEKQVSQLRILGDVTLRMIAAMVTANALVYSLAVGAFWIGLPQPNRDLFFIIYALTGFLTFWMLLWLFIHSRKSMNRDKK